MSSIVPSDRGVTIGFGARIHRDEFANYLLLAFFSNEHFLLSAHKDMTMVVILCKQEGDQSARVKQALNFMEERIPQQVSNLLFKNGDAHP